MEREIIDARAPTNQLILVLFQLFWPDALKPFNFWLTMDPSMLLGVKWFEGEGENGRYWSFAMYFGPFMISVSRNA